VIGDDDDDNNNNNNHSYRSWRPNSTLMWQKFNRVLGKMP